MGPKMELKSKVTPYILIGIFIFLPAYVILLFWTTRMSDSKTPTTQYELGVTPLPSIPSNWTPHPTIETDCKVKVAVILCEDSADASERKTSSNSRGVAFERQINQTIVLIKSILMTVGEGSSCIKVILISDQRKHFDRVKEEIFGSWDARFLRRLELGYVSLKYPTGTSWMRRLFRPCATLRLFLPDLLDYDSIIYLDTDIIFLRNIESLWSEFDNFRELTLGAMGPCLFHYGTSRNSVPYYGSSGLNAGVMLMNLSRMRNTQWTRKIRTIGTQYRSQIKLADQDILNIYFHDFPEEVQLLSCDWNFRPFQCHRGSFCQDAEIEDGISALHGNALSFTENGPEPVFSAIFQEFLEIQLTGSFDIQDVIRKLESGLHFQKYQSPCANLFGFRSLLLRRLLNQNSLTS